MNTVPLLFFKLVLHSVPTGIPADQQNLIFLSETLPDEKTLKDLKILDGATLRLVPAMRGGPINMRRSMYNLQDKH